MAQIAKHINYTLERLSKHKANVRIPGSLHLDSFDQRGDCVRLHSLYSLFDSAIYFAFFNQVTTGFLDITNLLKEVTIYASYSNVTIEKDFYDHSFYKFPFTCDIELTEVRASSYTLKLNVVNPVQNVLYATMEVISVSVHPVKRMRCPLPLWWAEKYALLSPDDRCPHVERKPNLNKPKGASAMDAKILYSDTDINNHTHWNAYIRFCQDALMRACLKKKYLSLNEVIARQGVKFFEIFYMKESVLDDEINVFSWEMKNDKDIGIEFELKKGESICCMARMQFHDQRINSKL